MFIRSALTMLPTAIALLLLPWSTPALAQKSGAKGPPIAVGGYAYSFQSRAGVHMFICRIERCVPGSKVSYILGGPEANPDFEMFKKGRLMLAQQLPKYAPPGMTFKFGKPELSKDKIVTIFKAVREDEGPGAARQYVITTKVHAKTVTFNLISSATTKAVAEGNRAEFMVSLMLWAQIHKQR